MIKPLRRSKSVVKGGLTVATYAERWAAARLSRGVRTAENTDLARLRVHVFPLIGQKPIADVTAEDLLGVVAKLDELAHDEASKFTGNTALKVWGAVTKMFKDACRSKVPTLRVRHGNPTLEVEGPDSGEKRAKQWLYPDEFLQLVSCATLPLRWRRIYALATYLFTRAGELEVLDWADVDLAHGRIRIHRAIDRHTGETKETKAAEVREFQIEPALLPLLKAMHAESSGGGVVAKMPPVEDLAATFRNHLERAGLKRAALSQRTNTSSPITFHDLRATGLTWLAMRGDEPLTIRDRAGHANLATTEHYIRRGREAGGLGTPFPELPGDLISERPKCPTEKPEGNAGPNRATVLAHPTAKSLRGFRKRQRPQRDLNPCYSLERAVSWAELDDGDESQPPGLGARTIPPRQRPNNLDRAVCAPPTVPELRASLRYRFDTGSLSRHGRSSGQGRRRLPRGPRLTALVLPSG
jgi:integrase